MDVITASSHVVAGKTQGRGPDSATPCGWPGHPAIPRCSSQKPPPCAGGPICLVQVPREPVGRACGALRPQSRIIACLYTSTLPFELTALAMAASLPSGLIAPEIQIFSEAQQHRGWKRAHARRVQHKHSVSPEQHALEIFFRHSTRLLSSPQLVCPLFSLLSSSPAPSPQKGKWQKRLKLFKHTAVLESL